MRVFLIVIDSFGIGELPDAASYGDVGSNTYCNIVKQTGLKLPNLARIGLNHIDGVDVGHDEFAPIGRYARLSEISPAKDTTAGHFEIAGLPLRHPFPVYPNAFPKDLIEKLEKECGCTFLANEVASGTEIINRLGDEHCQTRKPILYTSQDSVLQIAVCVDVIPLDELYRICEKARSVLKGKHCVGRVIARPFKKGENGYYRTPDRKDYALPPPNKTMLDILTEHEKKVYGIGKISDIFCGQGITDSIYTKNNTEGIQQIEFAIKTGTWDLVFANLVDTDSAFGHRNDVNGYANALKEIDQAVGRIITALKDDDYLIITADHGCDPTTISTDHSREYVPLLVYNRILQPKNYHTIRGFDFISKSILDLYQIKYYAKSIFKENANEN